jgi:serine/threonine-protein kinase
MMVPLTGERTVTPLVTGPNTESLPRISPDGKWLVYQSNETGRFEIYVRPFPANGPRTPVSDNGGTEPLWGRSGRSLYYRGPNGEIVEVVVTTGASFSIGARKVVLTGDYLTDSSHPNYDIAPDGRFLMLKRAGAEAQTVVVHNWGRELREKTRKR